MQLDPDGFDWQRWAFHPLVASLFGAAIQVVHSVPGTSRGIQIANAFTAFVSGIFLGAVVVEWREMSSRPLIGLTHLLFAIGGLILMGGFLNYLKETKFADLPFIRGFLKGVAPKEGT